MTFLEFVELDFAFAGSLVFSFLTVRKFFTKIFGTGARQPKATPRDFARSDITVAVPSPPPNPPRVRIETLTELETLLGITPRSDMMPRRSLGERRSQTTLPPAKVADPVPPISAPRPSLISRPGPRTRITKRKQS